MLATGRVLVTADGRADVRRIRHALSEAAPDVGLGTPGLMRWWPFDRALRNARRIVVHGSVGHMSGFMAQAGVMLIGGDAGDALGDSLYEAVIYVAGKIASLGSDARIEELTEADVRAVKALAELSGFDHVQPENVTRVASARGLYNFDALKDQKY